ncbi:3-oxo-5-alpha-steroid 4-dehydrogenase 1 [Lynx pardinus]|uniref:3-oxo-5-alpha-steroid 4-dehydrogenase 1 n=1 Tax=Lynx pardinus TaxID=191816 RepID=A0A485P255_LYNPA|nr:3-oxo-5-alpha-steroid 4-dehydrogenase 1 [Lynx pardinus]
MEPAEGCHLDAFAYLECALGLLGSVQLTRWAYGRCASPRPTYQLPQRLRHAPNRILLATLLIHYAQRYLSQYAVYADDWVTDPRFLVGFCLWLIGMLINIHSDHILRNLRKPGETI